LGRVGGHDGSHLVELTGSIGSDSLHPPRDKSVSIGTRLTKLTLLTVKYPLILLKEGKRGEEIHKTRE